MNELGLRLGWREGFANRCLGLWCSRPGSQSKTLTLPGTSKTCASGAQAADLHAVAVTSTMANADACAVARAVADAAG